VEMWRCGDVEMWSTIVRLNVRNVFERMASSLLVGRGIRYACVQLESQKCGGGLSICGCFSFRYNHSLLGRTVCASAANNASR
jgi:hypothetical protein